jgi:hypothetical protein
MAWRHEEFHRRSSIAIAVVPWPADPEAPWLRCRNPEDPALQAPREQPSFYYVRHSGRNCRAEDQRLS